MKVEYYLYKKHKITNTKFLIMFVPFPIDNKTI